MRRYVHSARHGAWHGIGAESALPTSYQHGLPGHAGGGGQQGLHAWGYCRATSRSSRCVSILWISPAKGRAPMPCLPLSFSSPARLHDGYWAQQGQSRTPGTNRNAPRVTQCWMSKDPSGDQCDLQVQVGWGLTCPHCTEG